MLVGSHTHLLALRLLGVHGVVIDNHMGVKTGDGRSCGRCVSVAGVGILVVLLTALVASDNNFREQLAELVALDDILRLRGVVYRERR